MLNPFKSTHILKKICAKIKIVPIDPMDAKIKMVPIDPMDTVLRQEHLPYLSL